MTGMSSTTTYGDMRSYIDTCLECYRACVSTAQHCLDLGGKHAERSHITLLLDCGEICQTSAAFMLRASDHHGAVCGVCADVCRHCATSCESLGASDPVMQQCAEICRHCERSCRAMARM